MVAIELLDMKANIAPLTSWEYHALSVAKGDLMEIYLTKERNSIQKMQTSQAKRGNVNSGFFHRFLAAKKRHQHAFIFELQSINGISLLTYHDIERETLEFFSPLYTRVPSHRAFLLIFIRL